MILFHFKFGQDFKLFLFTLRLFWFESMPFAYIKSCYISVVIGNRTIKNKQSAYLMNQNY